MPWYPLGFRLGDTGLTPAFVRFERLADGVDVADPPAISEVGHGLYRFEYVPNMDIVFVVDGGAGIDDTDARYVRGVLSPQDDRLDASVSSRATPQDVATAADGVPATVAPRAAPAALVDAVNVLTSEINEAATPADLAALPAQILATSLPGNPVAGSVGEALAKLVEAHQVLTGSWELDSETSQLVIYAPDDATVLLRFDLFDSLGQSAVRDVVERRRFHPPPPPPPAPVNLIAAQSAGTTNIALSWTNGLPVAGTVQIEDTFTGALVAGPTGASQGAISAQVAMGPMVISNTYRARVSAVGVNLTSNFSYTAPPGPGGPP